MNRISVRQLPLYFYLLRTNFRRPCRTTLPLRSWGSPILKTDKIAVLLEATNMLLIIAIGIFVNALHTNSFAAINDSS